MIRFRIGPRPLLVAIIIAMFAFAAQAQATRTWVSGVGDDANPCSRTAPCKTFAGAISKTFINGEIDCLDPGGFGTVTITKSITIDGTHGSGFGSILASGAPQGILINISNTNSNDPLRVVRLRGLSINGVGASGSVGTNTGTNGIRILAAQDVYVEDCVIAGFSNRGITDERTLAGGSLFVNDSILRNNTQSHIGIAPTGAGSIQASIDNVRAIGSISNTGFVVIGNVKASFRNCVANDNVHGFFAQGTGAELNIVNCIASHNSSTGIFVTAPAIVRLSDSTLTNNGNSISTAPAQVSSAGNNVITGNTIQTLPSGPAIPAS